MSDQDRLNRFLSTDPRDVGCDEAMAVLHIYVDLTVDGGNAAERYPGVAAHLLACGPCGEDFAGLLAAVAGNLGRRADPRRCPAPGGEAPRRPLRWVLCPDRPGPVSR